MVDLDVLDPDTVTPTSNFDTIKPSDPIVIIMPSSATKFSTSTSIPPQKKSQTLLISISTLCGVIILSLVLIIMCLAMALKHIVRSESRTLSATCSSDSINVYAELESSFPHESDAVEGDSQLSAPNESQDEQDVPGPGVYERISILL